MDSQPLMLSIDSFKSLLWFWYIYQNMRASETHLELQAYMVQLHQRSGGEVREHCLHDILSYASSLRTIQWLFHEWNFRMGSALVHLSQDQQWCQQTWLLFYDMGLNDQEILRFVKKETSAKIILRILSVLCVRHSWHITSVTPRPGAILTAIPCVLNVLNPSNPNPLYPDALWFYALLSWSLLILGSYLLMISPLAISRHDPVYLDCYLLIETSSHRICLMLPSVL